MLERACLCGGSMLLSLYAAAQIDRSLWSEARLRAYEASASIEVGEPAAILRIRSVSLEVPVYASASELHLNRGAGLIAGMGLPDEGGNLGIAGHRDGFFRALKDVRRGDLIEVRTRAHVHEYRVTDLVVVDPSDLRPLADTDDPTVTLVTCYPFYYVGHAPQRFVVRGTYQWPSQEYES